MQKTEENLKAIAASYQKQRADSLYFKNWLGGTRRGRKILSLATR